MSSTPITLSGFGTFDASSLINSLLQQASAPITALAQQQSKVQSKLSAIQVLSQNVLGLRTAADNLVDPTLFSSVSASTSNSASVGAVAANGAQVGNYDVQVGTLARPAVVQSHDGYASADAVVGTGTITINVGSANNQPITIDSAHQTLSGIRDAINAAGDGVTASIVKTSSGANPYYLVLTGKTAGDSNTISFSGTLGGNAFTTDSTRTPQSATLTVNGVSITSDSNTVADAIPGVTLTLNQANSSSQVGVSTSIDLIKSRIKSFVAAYNTQNTFSSIQSQYNSSTKTSGVLSGDSTLATVRNGVHDVAIGLTSNGGLYSTLADLGIEFQKDGSLTVNDGVLTDALTNHLSDVQTFLQGPNSDGFAYKLQSMAATLSDPINGILPATTTNMQATVNSLQDSINNMAQRLDLQRVTLQQQFSAAQQAIANLQAQGSALAGFSSSLSGSSSSLLSQA
jgi:flagellar hook-associated protein 2